MIPSKLDAEVAVVLFNFQWWASKQTDSTGKIYCVLHVPDEWLNRGWVRFNWAKDWHIALPNQVTWPTGNYIPFEDWYKGVGRETRTSFDWTSLPSFSSEWKACGMVIDWLTEHCNWSVNKEILIANFDKSEIMVSGWKTLQEGLCKLALKVAQKTKG